MMFVQTEITTDQLDGRHAHIRQRQVVAFLGTFAGPAQQVWLPGNDLQDPATWGAPPLCTLEHMHEDLLNLRLHRSAGSSTARAASGAGGGAASNAGANLQPQHAGSQDNGNGKLVLPQRNRLHEAFKRSQVSHPASSSSQDQQPTRPSPTRNGAGPSGPNLGLGLVPFGMGLGLVGPNSVATRPHAAAQQTLAPVQGPESALRWHAF